MPRYSSRRPPVYEPAEMLGMAVILAALCLIVAAMLVPGLWQRFLP